MSVAPPASPRPARVRPGLLFALAVAVAVLAVTTAGRYVPARGGSPSAGPVAGSRSASSPTPTPTSTPTPTTTGAVDCVGHAPRICFSREHRDAALALVPVFDRLYRVARQRGYGELVPDVLTERSAAQASVAAAGAGGRRQMFIAVDRDHWPANLLDELTGTMVQPECPPEYFAATGDNGTSPAQPAYAVAATWVWLAGDGFTRDTLAGQSPLTPSQVRVVLDAFGHCAVPPLVGVTTRADVFAAIAAPGRLATGGVVVHSRASDQVVTTALRRAAARVRLVDNRGREYPDAAAVTAAHEVDDGVVVPRRVSSVYQTVDGPAFAVTWGGGSSGSPFAVSAMHVVTEELRRSGVLDARLVGLSGSRSAR